MHISIEAKRLLTALYALYEEQVISGAPQLDAMDIENPFEADGTCGCTSGCASETEFDVMPQCKELRENGLLSFSDAGNGPPKMVSLTGKGLAYMEDTVK